MAAQAEEARLAEQEAREALAEARRIAREEREAKRKAEIERKKQEAQKRREEEKRLTEVSFISSITLIGPTCFSLNACSKLTIRKNMVFNVVRNYISFRTRNVCCQKCTF